MPTFRSDSSANTTMTINLTETGRSGSVVYVRVDWSVTLGSQTQNNSNRTLYIYSSDGALLGAAVIKTSLWDNGRTYSGAFDIAFDTGTTSSGAWEVYIQTNNAGTDSCIWTNRTYCYNFSFSWSLYWSGASAPTNPTLSPNPYENTVTFSWGAASPGVNNGILGYHVYYRLNNGGEYLAGLGNVTSWTPDVSGWARGTVVDFHVAAITGRGDNPWSGWSNAVTKNRVPNTPTSLSLAKAFFVPGETVRVYFSNNGDPDNNLAGFEAALEQDAVIRGKNASGSATHVDVSTAGWTPGVYYRLRIRGYDAHGIVGGWSAYSPAFLLGLPMKIAPAQGTMAKTVASMKIAPAQGGSFKSVAGMKIAPAQGPINKTVF